MTNNFRCKNESANIIMHFEYEMIMNVHYKYAYHI